MLYQRFEKPKLTTCLYCFYPGLDAIMASIAEVAKDAGLLALNPSDLVYGTNGYGVTYYNYILSCKTNANSATLYLIKFNEQTAVEQMEMAMLTNESLKEYFPIDPNESTWDSCLVLIGLIQWLDIFKGQKILVLCRNWVPDKTLETIDKLTKRHRIDFHVQTIESESERSSPSSMQCMLQRLMLCDCQTDVFTINQRILQTAKRQANPRSLFSCCFNL